LHNQSNYVPINSKFIPKDIKKNNICPCKDKKCSVEKCTNLNAVWEDKEQNDSKIKYIPPMIKIPKNLYFTGTVNIDESTEPFSKKVLDRANVLEFNEVNLESLNTTDKEKQNKIKIDNYKILNNKLFKEDSLNTIKDFHKQYFGKESHYDRDVLKSKYLAVNNETIPELNESILANYYDLHKIFIILEQKHMHFGYRVVKEILDFMANSFYDDSEDQDIKRKINKGEKLEKKEEENLIIEKKNCLFHLKDKNEEKEPLNITFDLQILQKILPKISGSKEKVAKILMQLYSVCLSVITDECKKLFSKEIKDNDLKEIWIAHLKKIPEKKYPKSAKKFARMIDKVFETGNTSFFE